MPQSISQNTWLRRMPKNEVKKRIIFCGHTDSAYEWSLMKIKQNFMVFVLVSVVIINLVFLALLIHQTAIAKFKWYILIVVAIALVFNIGLFNVCTFKVVVPGANDNLSGCLSSIGVIKAMEEANIEL